MYYPPSNIPRLIVAGNQSCVGKTTITIGLVGALLERGLEVQTFKVGPDYIDPSYHAIITSKPCRNLDAWLVPPKNIVELFLHGAGNADIAIIEGVMGIYDGFSGLDETGSTAQLAKLLKAPVILIVDALNMARSVGALVLGYKNFDTNLNLAGVILNRIASPSHAKWCKEAVESKVKIPVLGVIPFSKEILMPERHLGLIPTQEKKTLNIISKIVEAVKPSLDLNQIIQIANSAEKLPSTRKTIYLYEKSKVVKIGVAKDESFHFYYQDNLDLLSSLGAEIIFFSPLHDRRIPDVHGIYLGGGFPEVLASGLEANSDMRKDLLKKAEGGMPIYAECGGLMYLTNFIVGFDGKKHSMVGVLEGETVMVKQLTMNYTLMRAIRDNILSFKGFQMRGHEFHFSKIVNIPMDAKFAYEMRLGVGIEGKRDGWLQYNILASYGHLHFASNIKLAKNLIENCKKYKHSQLQEDFIL